MQIAYNYKRGKLFTVKVAKSKNVLILFLYIYDKVNVTLFRFDFDARGINSGK